MTSVTWSLIDQGAGIPMTPGDLVSAEAGGLPIYQVVDISGDRVWLKEDRSHRDYVLPIQSLRWKMLKP